MTIPGTYPFAHAYGCQCMMCVPNGETIVPAMPSAPWPPSVHHVTSITPTGPVFSAALKTPQRFQSRFRARGAR